MELWSGGDRRHHPRLPFTGPVRATEFQQLGSSATGSKGIEGQIRNISSVGICLVTRHPLNDFHMVRCELRLQEIPVAIPLLAQVRWTNQDPGGLGRIVGLQFLL